MKITNRGDPSRGAMTLQEQFGRMFGEVPERTGEESNLTAWAPAVDIYETENDLVIKADLPEVNPQDLDIRVLSAVQHALECVFEPARFP